MGKRQVAVAMGGYSSEFEISLNSGKIVCDSLNRGRYQVYPIHILKDAWYYLSPEGDQFPINKSDFSFSDGQQTVIPDVIFNTIHGTPGEDGRLAAYWELLNIPQTSSNFYAAALSFNKRDCLSVLKHFGIHCANSYYANKDVSVKIEEIIKIVGLPCFVKPSRAGSSFGISKVYRLDEMQPAMDKAFKEDREIIIETALIGIEVSVGVYRDKDILVALPPTEIVSENDFFDYEAKYLGKSQEITPARISEEELQAVQLEAKKVYQLLNLKGISRSDFIIQDGIPHFIEVNTTPGLSAESIVPKQVQEYGMALGEFFEGLIENALAKNPYL